MANSKNIKNIDLEKAKDSTYFWNTHHQSPLVTAVSTWHDKERISVMAFGP